MGGGEREEGEGGEGRGGGAMQNIPPHDLEAFVLASFPEFNLGFHV